MKDNSSNGPLPTDSSSCEDSFSNLEGCDVNEDQQYDDGNVYQDQNYLELFRRAVRIHDRGMQRWLEQHYSAMVIDWIRDHPRRDLACRLYPEQYYVTQTFDHFWQITLQQQKCEINSLADALYYLRVCLNAAILEALRNYSLQGVSSSRKSLGGEEKESYSNDDANSREMWRIIEEKIPDTRNRRLAFLLFQCALRPVEIVRSCPQDFSEVQEVSRMRRDILEQLSH